MRTRGRTAVTVPVATVAGMTTHAPEFKLDRPGALIAALPAILGFTPHDSLVLVSLDRGQIGAVLRIDLGDDLMDGLGGLVDVAAAAHPDAAIAVIVDPEGALCAACTDSHRQLCARLDRELDNHGITLLAAHLVDRVEAGGRWQCVDGCGSRGQVEDPESSPVTAAAVFDGRRLYGCREDLQAVIAVADTARTARVAEAVAALRAGTMGGTPDDRARRAVEDVLAATAQVAAGENLTDAEIAVVALGLTDLRVRDTVYALAVGECAEAAETVWALLSRVLPESLRAEALVQLAFSAYVRGDGPLAGLSLEAAQRIDPTHRMAALLDSALQHGMRPEQIRALAITSYRLADELGVVLPGLREIGRRAG